MPSASQPPSSQAESRPSIGHSRSAIPEPSRPPMAYTQDKRPLRVTTALGKDVLLLERFSGEEGVSAPFHFVLEMLSENGAIDPDSLLRKPLTVEIEIPGGGKRFVHGIANRLSQLGRRAGMTAYRVEVVPWLWFLSLTN